MADETVNAMSDIVKPRPRRHFPGFRFHGGGSTYFTRRFGKIKNSGGTN
jgi:hypothetical protein